MIPKKIIFLFCCVVILLSPFLTEAAQRGIKKVRPISPLGSTIAGDQWLFVIGINTYSEWPRLKTAVNDAKSFRNVLLSRYYFDKEHLIELYDEKATRKNIISSLRFLAKKTNKNDSLIIFYAGHGHVDSITKAGSWIPVESGTRDVSAWISNHDVKNYLRIDAIKAKHILLISDSCFAGDFFRGHRGRLPEVTDKVIKKAYRLSSRQAVTSGGLEPVYDDGFGKNSVFSYFLIKALKENRKPFLVPSDIFPDIRAGVAQNAEQFPNFGSLRGLGGQQGGEFVLFLKQRARLDSLQTKAVTKEKEYKRLKQMELEAKRAKVSEDDEIARRERELARLNRKINQIKRRLEQQDVGSNDDLDSMLAMARQKENQEKRLEELRRQRKLDEEEKEERIKGLKQQGYEKNINALKGGIEKYNKIVSTKYGSSMKDAAWNSLVSKFPHEWSENVTKGDSESLLITAHLSMTRDQKYNNRTYDEMDDKVKKRTCVRIRVRADWDSCRKAKVLNPIYNNPRNRIKVHVVRNKKSVLRFELESDRASTVKKMCRFTLTDGYKLYVSAEAHTLTSDYKDLSLWYDSANKEFDVSMGKTTVLDVELKDEKLTLKTY